MKRITNIFKKNKGFTLVELIVVIAIIGVLTVVLAPEYLDYVEKSRIATDKNAIDEVAHAAETVFVSIEKKAEFKEMQIQISSQGVARYLPSTTTSDLVEGVNEIISESSYTYKSNYYRGKTVKIQLNETTGIATADTDRTVSISEQLGLPGLVDRYGGWIGIDSDDIDWELFDSNANALIADAEQFAQLGIRDQINIVKDIAQQSLKPCEVCGCKGCTTIFRYCTQCGKRH